MKGIVKVLIAGSLIFVGCKNTAEEPQKVEEKATPEAKLIVDFSFKTDQQDVFRIMLNNIEVDELQKKNIQFFEDVAPSSNFESFHAEFDANNMSNNVVINLGNINVKNVEIESIKVTYGDNEIIASTPVQITEYFALNKFVTLDSVSSTLSTNRVDNQHFPTISLKRKSINYLKKE